MTILAVYREAFSVTPQVMRLPDGETLLAMRRRMTCLPMDFNERGVICVNGHPAPQALWDAIRPKAAVTEVTFHIAPLGGGSSDGKNPLALIASIALVAVGGWIAGGGLGTYLGAWAGANTIGAAALSAGVMLAGNLLIGALTAPPAVSSSTADRRALGESSATGNVLEANGPIPRVVGTRRVFPPFAVEPLMYFDGQDEVVEAVYCLAGPHALEDIKVGDAYLAEMTGVDYEVMEGWPGDPQINLVTRQSKTEQLSSELKGHTTAEDDGSRLDTAGGTVEDSLPVPLVVGTRDDPDEHWLQIVFPSGLHRNGGTGTGDRVRIPFRIRIRPEGSSTWLNLPELHYQGASLRALRATIKLQWGDFAAEAPTASAGEGWVEARISSAAQTAEPAGGGWTADSWFDEGAGDAWLNAGNLGTTRVQRVFMDRYEAVIHLGGASFPQARYEVEIVRGVAMQNSLYAPSSYNYNGSVWNFFGYRNPADPQIAESRDSMADAVTVARSVSIWNEHPVPLGSDLALISLRARNRQLGQVSVMAGGFVRDWDGTDWTMWTVTDNPAPHLRDIYVGRLNLDAIPASMIDNGMLLGWRAHCDAMGYTCNALVEGQSVAEAAQIVAACGYGRPYMSEVWGVIWDYDRSAEAPVQIFTPRNMGDFSWEKSFPRLPDGFLVNFPDRDRNWETRQIPVLRSGVTETARLLEQIDYEGLDREDDVVARAAFDLAQAEARSVYYSFTAPAEAIVCRRGDLVGVYHDSLISTAGAARIVGIETDGGGNITAIVLDSAVPVIAEPDMHGIVDMHAVEDMHLVGVTSGVVIRDSGGSLVVEALANATGETDRLEFSPAILPGEIEIGNLVTVGPIGRQFDRMIVFGIEPHEDFTATLTCVDEAPELWS